MHGNNITNAPHSARRLGRNGVYLTADEVDRLARLLFEVRELTLSRETFSNANELLRRLVGDAGGPSLVAADSLDL